jgi:ribonuclease HII
MINFIAGIDEAGRGPLIGPLVIAVAAIQEGKEQELKDLGVKDSKLLTEKQREDILKHLERIIKYELIILNPEDVDAAVESNNTNLNWLEADHGASILNKLDVKLDNQISRCIIDCPSTNVGAYSKYFSEKVDNKETVLQVEHKADLNHLIVGAASIIAKVTREKELERLKKKYKVDFGSGYPSDPNTKRFIEEHWNNPKISPIIRKSWETYKKIVRSKAQKGLGDF